MSTQTTGNSITKRSQPIAIAPKSCSCGIVHTQIPAGALFSDVGFYWDCSCSSTLMMTFRSVAEQVEAAS